ncbi:unnamed protein product [Amoebophrya sp. A25]|nr:unnamed protein product [Amoebophrya sp. A25]|eukprot:GSA25T00014766001.1
MPSPARIIYIDFTQQSSRQENVLGMTIPGSTSPAAKYLMLRYSISSRTMT